MSKSEKSRVSTFNITELNINKPFSKTYILKKKGQIKQKQEKEKNAPKQLHEDWSAL